MESMLEGMAEFYSANLSQNVKRGFRENALKGKWNGGSLPIGYKVVDHKLAVDEETAPIVVKIFEMSADGYTAKEIYDYLRQKQIRRPNGKEIAYNSVLHILKNRTYIGEYKHFDDAHDGARRRSDVYGNMERFLLALDYDHEQRCGENASARLD